MNTAKSPFMIKVSYEDQPNKIHFNRKQSLQLERGSRESLNQQVKQKYLSSYPLFQATKSKIISPPLNQENCEEYQLERKKSSFLKNYNEKLKRERKRQLKLKSSIKQIKISKNPTNQNRTFNHSDQLFENKANSKTSTIFSEQQQKTASILVLRKTPFLDTSASIFKQRKDYSKDSSLQLLLKQINDIKLQEKKQIQKLNQHKKSLEKGFNSKNIASQTKENFFTKYERGFLLPMRRKIAINTGNLSKTSELVYNLESSLASYGSKEKIKPYKKITERTQMQKFYNFKQIDPWQNPTQRENNQSFDNHFLFHTIQN